MWKCKKCLEMNPDSTMFCQSCGEKRENKIVENPAQNKAAENFVRSGASATWVCKNCSGVNPGSGQFCQTCGEKNGVANAAPRQEPIYYSHSYGNPSQTYARPAYVTNSSLMDKYAEKTYVGKAVTWIIVAVVMALFGSLFISSWDTFEFGVFLLVTSGTIAVLAFDYLISKEFEFIAIEKGYDGKKYFWYSFLFSAIGYLLVIALPQKK